MTVAPEPQCALVFSEEKGLRLVEDHAKPVPGPKEALLEIQRASICSTDLEILKGYVPGFDGVLGHECVAKVVACPSQPDLVGARVTTEINCRTDDYEHPSDPVFTRNHAPNRVVLGIIAKDGVLAQYATVPVENLHCVPDNVTDQEACFTEPLAAACRIVEQQLVSANDKVAVIGDGKLGLLAAQVLVLQGAKQLTHFGRHQRKLDLVSDSVKEVVAEDTATVHAAAFDVVVEASGSSQGISLALALARPMGTVVLKSTCSLKDPEMPPWSGVANDIVVQEKRLAGSRCLCIANTAGLDLLAKGLQEGIQLTLAAWPHGRCGPFPPALGLLQNPRMKKLVNSMVDGVFPLRDGKAAFAKAQGKGTLKVQVVIQEEDADAAVENGN